MNARFATPQTTPDSGWEMPTGVVLSIVLHLLVALLAIFGLPFVTEPPPPVEESVPVDLVPLGEVTTSAPPKAAEQQPVEKPAEKPPEPPKQEVKAEPPKPEPPKEEAKPPPPPPPPPPKAEAPPPPPAPAPPPPEPKAEVPLPAPEKKPEPPKETPKPPDQLAEVKPVKKPPPPQDDMQSLLKTLDKMRPQPPKQDDLAKAIDAMRPSQPTPPAPAQPQQQQASSSSNASNISLQPTASDIDFVRGQIERHWNFDIGARDAANLIVQVRVALLPDGTVSRADIVSDPRYDSDSFYRSAADSARRAVLAASPLKLPPGKYDTFKDFTFRFDPRNAVR